MEEIELELKHLASYGDKECKYQTREGNILTFDFEDLYDIQVAIEQGAFEPENYKLLLHPLSDLTKEIEHNGGKFVPMEKLKLKKCDSGEQLSQYYFEFKPQWASLYLHHIQKLFEWHFDVAGLIEAGLAIDINTLKIKK